MEIQTTRQDDRGKYFREFCEIEFSEIESSEKFLPQAQ